LLNSLGFPNEGLDAIKKRLKNTAKISCLGINIGPNKDTSIDNMQTDYIKCYEELSEYADFITINVSSPNTPKLRQLQDRKFIAELVSLLIESRNQSKKNPKIFIKVSPDERNQTYLDIINIINKTSIDGLIVTNTSNNLKLKSSLNISNLEGGLSGKVLRNSSNNILRLVKEKLNNEKIIVAVGGVFDVDSYNEKLDLGADLVQIYTGFVYEGPNLVKKIIKNDKQKSSNS